MPLFIRYQAHAERQYSRALEEFGLRALRPELPNDEIPNEPVADLQPTPESDTYLDPEIDRCCVQPSVPAANPTTVTSAETAPDATPETLLEAA